MTAELKMREGRLDEALAALQQQVRAEPSAARHRVFLFQLLSILGEWERALTQLNVLGDMDASSLAMVQTYRPALACEALRVDVFSGKRSPLLFGEPEPWMALQVEALRLGAEGRHAEATAMRGQAFEQAPAAAGTLDGHPFEWIADADARLGPMLEAIVNGRYYWIPMHRLREVQLEKPEDLRDLVWLPAALTFENGGQTVALVPARYPGTERSADARLRLAKLTEWSEPVPGVWEGRGQRLLTTDVGEYPLLETRKVCLGAEETGG